MIMRPICILSVFKSKNAQKSFFRRFLKFPAVVIIGATDLLLLLLFLLL